MIERAMSRLRGVQRELVQFDTTRRSASFQGWPDYRSRLLAADIGGELAIEYYGINYEAHWQLVLTALVSSELAPYVALLRFSGPDEGANGTRSYDFATLIAAEPRFPRLADFRIRHTEPGDHNMSVVVDDQLPRLVAVMPQLRVLSLPQAPEPAFFSLPLTALRSIRIGTDWRTRGFIEHLAEATTLPALTSLDFTDSIAPFLSATHGSDPEQSSTPFAHFERLLRSPVGGRLRTLVLRNTRLHEREYRSLQAIRPQLQLAVIVSPPSSYVSHWGRTDAPYAHLLPRD